MKRTGLILMVVLGIVLLTGTLYAQTANQTINLTIGSVMLVAPDAASHSLSITTGTVDQIALTPATAAGTYRWVTNQAPTKITAELDSDMPAGSTLQLRIGAGAFSPLTTAPTDVRTGMPRGAGNEDYTFQFTANATVDPASIPASKTVTWTITN